ncbi:MAG: hypothetical protein V2J11_03315, partial [Desulfofustis sp.]|nr:hypothetical protein [Desulfofustis sp.]
MSKYRRLILDILIVLALSGCMSHKAPPPAENFAEVLSMPPLNAAEDSGSLAPVFGPDEEYTGSPLEEVARLGLFKTHEPKENQFALLENGDMSFTARAQLLEQAEKSIRIQALIFAGDESGLYLAEILKR